ncbi:hypothetical protein NIES25_34740 [Nostoc linckia NIES-25]|nr:hypothetical protein NIES25_34740 [Nostoc linckia NIES-25]
MRLQTKPYLTQVNRWLKAGRHIVAQYDDQSIVVDRAYRPAIGKFAVTYGYFGDAIEKRFSLGEILALCFGSIQLRIQREPCQCPDDDIPVNLSSQFIVFLK